MKNSAIWAENDRVRTEGTRTVVEAAIAASAEVVLFLGVTLLYPDGGEARIDEETPAAPSCFVVSSLAAEEAVARFTGRARSGGDRSGGCPHSRLAARSTRRCSSSRAEARARGSRDWQSKAPDTLYQGQGL